MFCPRLTLMAISVQRERVSYKIFYQVTLDQCNQLKDPCARCNLIYSSTMLVTVRAHLDEIVNEILLMQHLTMNRTEFDMSRNHLMQ